MSRTWSPLGLVVAALFCLPACASTEEEPPPGEGPAITAQQQEELEAFLESQAPGAQHEKLAPLIGRFDAHVLHWMTPDQPPSESTGVLENTWALGGLFVLSQYRGEELGRPFEGLGLLGYDTLRQKYVGNWADSMSSAPWPTGTGELIEEDDALTLSRVMTDPMTGQLIKVRDVTTFVDKDHILYEIFVTRPGADETKVLEAEYTRIPA
jgi:hypothetical protein